MTHNWMLLLLFVENTLHMITYLSMLKPTKHFKRSYIYFRAREKTPMQLDRVNVVARFDSIGWANRERKRVNSNRNILSWNDSTLFYLWINMQSICASCKCVLLTRRRRQFSNTSICICKNLIAYEWRKTSSKNEINTRCMLHFDVNIVCDGSVYFISVFNSVDLFLVRIHTAEFLVWFNCHRILNQSMNDANACHSMADYHDDTRTKPTIKLSKQLTLNRRRWTVQWTYIFRLIDIIFMENFFRTFSMHFKPVECVYFSSSESVYCSVRTHLFIDWFFVFICNCKCGESEKETEREREREALNAHDYVLCGAWFGYINTNEH